MPNQIILGAFAAFGVFSCLWAIGGLFIPKARGLSIYICPEGAACDGAVLRYRWLHGLGIVKAPILIVNSALTVPEQRRVSQKHPYIEFCSLEELPSRLELERKEVE